MKPIRLRRISTNPVVKGSSNPLQYVALEHIESNLGRLVDGFEPEIREDDAAVQFAPGDVLYGKLRPYLAKALHPDFAGCASAELLVIRPGPNLISRYLFYIVLSRPFVEWATATSYGTKMPRTSWQQLGDYLVTIPSIERQHVVVGKLDHEVAKIDDLLRRLGARQAQNAGASQTLVGLLLERRSALITAGVTEQIQA